MLLKAPRVQAETRTRFAEWFDRRDGTLNVMRVMEASHLISTFPIVRIVSDQCLSLRPRMIGFQPLNLWRSRNE